MNGPSKIDMACSKFGMVLLCILMMDCCIFGAGRIVSAGPISFRMGILALLILTAIPLIFSQWKKLIHDKYLWFLLAFIVWLVIATLIGITNSNRKSLIITDLKGFAYFSFLPAAICILNSKERIHILMKCMMYASGFLALFTCFLLCSYLWFSDFFFAFHDFAFPLQVSAFSSISTKIPRLFFKSDLYLLCGCAFAAYFQIISASKKIQWRYIAITALCLFALLMTYTRSIYLAALVAAGGILFFFFCFTKKEMHRRFLTHLGAAVALFLVIVGIFSFSGKANYLGYAIMRSTISEIDEPTSSNPQNDSSGSVSSNPAQNIEEEMQNHYLELTRKSDQIRYETRQQLYEGIKNSPIIGNGLGAEIEIRPDGLNEYFYLDLLYKAGIIGLLLYLIPLIGMCIYLIRSFKKSNDNKLRISAWLAILLGFLSFSWFNPYMNAALGILFYCCVIAVFSLVDKDKLTDGKGKR